MIELLFIAFFSCFSGFLFLRLICPAIMNPKICNMMSGELAFFYYTVEVIILET